MGDARPPRRRRDRHMTSLVSREDIEDALVRAGVRNPQVRGRLMDLVHTYAVSMSRKFAGPSDLPPPPPDPYSRLLPGQADVAARVIRCADPHCLRVKPFREYTQDSSCPAGRKTTCKTCVRRRDRLAAVPRLGPVKKYLCRACGEHKELGFFPEEKRRWPSSASSCTECKEKRE